MHGQQNMKKIQTLFNVASYIQSSKVFITHITGLLPLQPANTTTRAMGILRLRLHV